MGTADRQAVLGLILDFAGVLTANPLSVHRAWCESEGLPPEAWRTALNEDPEGRRLYAALEVGEIDRPSGTSAPRPSWVPMSYRRT
jgi:putative hydrolase of the HAD superfamily